MMQFEFEITTADGVDTYKFEIVIQDDFRLIKEYDKDSILTSGRVNYYISKNGVKGDLQHGKESLKRIYDKFYADSDKTQSEDFWEAITICSSGAKLSTIRTL